MLRWIGRFSATLALLCCLLLLAAFAVRKSANERLFPPRTERIALFVVDHGYHAGVVLPRARLVEISANQGLINLESALSVFAAFDYVEIGWGELNFYQNVPAMNISAFPHVLRALFLPGNKSVLHVVGTNGDVKASFPRSDILRVEISSEGLVQIARFIDAGFEPNTAGEVAPKGPGLYGPSAFFNARENYHLLNLCNHWTGRLLESAGLPFSPIEATLSFGLMLDLKRRALAIPVD